MSYRVKATSLNMPDKLYRPGETLSDEAAAGISALNLAALLRDGVLVKEGAPERAAPAAPSRGLQEVEPNITMVEGKALAPASLAREIVRERGSEEPTRTEEQAIAEIAARRELEESKMGLDAADGEELRSLVKAFIAEKAAQKADESVDDARHAESERLTAEHQAELDEFNAQPDEDARELEASDADEADAALQNEMFDDDDEGE